jgi:hypothetical protein
VQFAIAIPIVKRDLPQGLVTGWAALSTDAQGRPVVDHQGDHIPIAELERAVIKAFSATGGKGVVGDMHRTSGHADVVESIVVSKAKREALGFGSGPEGWVVTLKVHDPELLAQITSGEKMELSIRGTAVRVPMEVVA